jgi:hypothetical protein
VAVRAMTLDLVSIALAVGPANGCHGHRAEADRRALAIRPVSRLKKD